MEVELAVAKHNMFKRRRQQVVCRKRQHHQGQLRQVRLELLKSDGTRMDGWLVIWVVMAAVVVVVTVGRDYAGVACMPPWHDRCPPVFGGSEPRSSQARCARNQKGRRTRQEQRQGLSAGPILEEEAGVHRHVLTSKRHH